MMDEFHRGFNEGMTKGAAIAEQDKADAERWRKLVRLNETYYLQTITVYHPERPGIQMTHRNKAQREIDKSQGIVNYKSGDTLSQAIDSIKE